MKRILMSASGIFAVIPGLAIIQSGIGAPPNYKLLFGGVVEALGVFSLVLLWVNRSVIRSMKKPKITKSAIASILLFLCSLIVYLVLFDNCVISDADRGTIFFPLLEKGELADVIGKSGSRQQAMRYYGKDAIQELIDKTPLARAITLMIFLIVYQSVFTFLVVAFGLLGIYVRDGP